MTAEFETVLEMVTRLAAAKLALPFMLLVATTIALNGNRRGALVWVIGTGGMGLFDFCWKIFYRASGFWISSIHLRAPSGHALLGAAIYPIFLGWFMAQTRVTERAQPLGSKHSLFDKNPALLSDHGFACGVAVAILIAWSRVALHAHSIAEAVTGCALGLAVSLTARTALQLVPLPPRRLLATAAVLLVAVGEPMLDDLPQLELVRKLARQVASHGWFHLSDAAPAALAGDS